MVFAAVFLPLFGALIAGFFGRKIGDKGAQFITCVFMGVSAVLTIPLVLVVSGGEPLHVQLLPWIVSGSFEAGWSLYIDTLSAVMLATVAWVSFLVHVYSIGYMAHDPHKARFMAYLSLFTFLMNMLVTADSLVQMFFGWEGVGLASYLLIGFWHERPAASHAAIKAFLVNRVGDFGFALGLVGIYLLFDSVILADIFSAAPSKADIVWQLGGFEVHALTLLCLLLFMGAMGKSAQIGLHTWLPDAMEGPTPVSALIHAATMVTAGVFMVARLSPLFELSTTALQVVTIVGATTAFFAATVACVQTDIKRVIAYSTCSQLGYMFFALGIGAHAAAIFHLVTHAFFKSLLFLGAGSVIHAMSNEQDMRKMGGIWKNIRFTYAMMWVGSLALAGLPFFSGYYSKDMIIEAAYAAKGSAASYAFVMGLIAAFLTAFYSWRLLFMTFHGTPKADEKVMAYLHESPKVMCIPLFLLAVGAVFMGFAGYDYFVGAGREHFWQGALAGLGENSVLEAAHHVSATVKFAPVVLALLGIWLAYILYTRWTDIPTTMVNRLPWLHRFLVKKWYFDELYDMLFVRPALRVGRFLWSVCDCCIIDDGGPNMIAKVVKRGAKFCSCFQSGYIFHYAFAMIAGLILLMSWSLFRLFN